MASRFWVGGSGLWSDTAHWSTTSGGGGGSAVPVAADSVTIDSGSGTAPTITADVPAIGLTLTVNKSDATLSLAATSTYTTSVTLTTGTIQTNGFACAWARLLSAGTSARALDITNSTVTLSGASSPALNLNLTGLTLTVTGSTIVQASTAKGFAPAGAVLNNVTFKNGYSSGIGSSFTANVLTVEPNTTITVTSGITITFTSLVSWNSFGNLATFTPSSTTNYTFSQASGYVWLNWVSLTKCTATGGARFYAGADSTDGGNNTGWTFAHLSMPGVAAGVGAASGVVNTTALLSGASAGLSTAAGTIAVQQFLAGAAVGVCAVVGIVRTASSIAGAAHGRSGAAARLTSYLLSEPHIRILTKPPLRLSTRIVTPSGRTYRWAQDEKNALNVPGGESATATMPGGYATYQTTLARKDSVDYNDLQRLSKVYVESPSGLRAWEGRLETEPVVSGEQFSISPGAVGMQAHLDDRQDCLAIFACVDASLWADAPLTEQIRYAALGIASDFSWASQSGGLVSGIQAGDVTAPSVGEIWFVCPAGVFVRKVQYSGTEWFMPAGWEAPTLFGHDEKLEDPADSYALTLDGAMHEVDLSTAKRAVSTRVFTGAASLPMTLSLGAMRALSHVGVYGTDIPTHQIDPALPDGVLASDVLRYVISTWCPHLRYTADSIPDSSFILPQLIFTSLPTLGSDIVKQATQYELLDWGVGDDDTFFAVPRGATARHWRAKSGPAQLQSTGPQTQFLWNEVVVLYQDVDGTARTVGPPGSGCDFEDPLLRDNDPLNPCNAGDYTRRATTQFAGVGSSAAAGQVGARFLEQSKLLDTSGQATLTGWVESTSGVLHAASEVWPGDDISFTDAASTAPRRIVNTSWTPANAQNQISLDAPPDGLDAILQRLSLALIAVGAS